MRKDLLCLSALLLLCAVLFGFQLGKAGLLDPDEPFYSLTAKEMLERGDPMTPRMFGEPQFEKPVLFYWVLYAAFRLFGISEFSARLGPCLAGTLTVLVVYIWGRLLFRRREPALLSSVILASGGQFIVLSRVVLTDIFLCLFITAALCSFTWGWRHEKARPIAWHLLFAFSALAFLTKGPLGFMVPFSGIAAFAMASGRTFLFTRLPWVSGLALFSAIGLPWYVLMTRLYGTGYLDHFFMHENVRRFFVAEHKGMDRWYFYPFVLAFGFFPWSAFISAGLLYAIKRQGAHLFLFLSFIVPFVFFMIAKSKLMSYIFPLYPLAALMAGSWGWKLYRAMRLGYALSVPGMLSFGFMWIVAPVTLAAGAWSFAAKSEIPILGPIAVIASFLVPFSWLSFYFLMRKKMMWSVRTMTAVIAVFSAIAFGSMMPQAGMAFSSQNWVHDYERLTKEKPETLFMTSKQFVRGMTFYTGAKGLGVFSNQPKGGFYTPHPIPIISDNDDFTRMKKNDFPVYFLIRGKELGHLMEGLAPHFSLSILKVRSQRILVRLDRV